MPGITWLLELHAHHQAAHHTMEHFLSGVACHGPVSLPLPSHSDPARQMAEGRGSSSTLASPAAHCSLLKALAPCLQTGLSLKVGRACEHPCAWSWPSF